MTSVFETQLMFDNSGKEFVHSSQLIQFFMLLGVISLFFGMVYRVFKIGKFYGDDVMEEIPPEIQNPGSNPKSHFSRNSGKRREFGFSDRRSSA